MKTIRIKVSPNSKKVEVNEIKEGVFAINTKAKAEDNHANREALELLSKELNIPQNKLRIISGHKRPNKIIEVL